MGQEIELVQEDGRSRVTRLLVAGRTVIRKEPLGPDAERELRHELGMLQRLRGVVGVAQLVDAPAYPGSIVMSDAGRTSLAGLETPLPVGEMIGVAAALARAVAGMHGRGVLHRDIAPANVALSPGGAPCLVGFGSATSMGEIRPHFTHHADVVGTLAYVAPEQTGRTGRSVDQRADLYAFGATLYELATGGPPFGSGDPLRLAHDQLARVPTPPAETNPEIPAPLCEIILRLLAKEPDDRYQSAEGVLRDLQQLQADPTAALRIGQLDTPLRLVAPSRLVGRDAEVAALGAAFRHAVSGECRGVFVGGAPGVGKTTLVDELRPMATSAGGWFVAGKFDQYRRDLAFDAVNQALRALGRLLLAEPEVALVAVRDRILAAVGANAALLTATVPEFATLLGVPPDGGDPLTAQARAQRTAAQVLRAVASPERPLAVFVDDLQWAGRTPLGVVDLLVNDEPAAGLLLVSAYREGDVEAAHPLAALLSRWRRQAGVQYVRLRNLSAASLVTLVAETLHTDEPTAATLAELIEPHTRGNPYDTVELLRTLRRDGVLTATAGGWRWEAVAVRAHLGESDTAGPAAGPVGTIMSPSRQLIEAMACLGGRMELSLLQAATGEPAGVVEDRLAPALDEHLLVTEPGAEPAMRFRHDRIREGLLRRMGPQQRRSQQLTMARKLARVPELFAVAAEQFLPAVGEIGDAEERRMVVGLLRRAADQAALTGDHALVNSLLSAALRLAEPEDAATLVALRTDRHAALFGLARLEEADEEYRAIERLCPTVLDGADATAVQVRSLSHRTRFEEALELGLKSLRVCGVDVPAPDGFLPDLDRGFDRLHRWLDDTDAAEDLDRPELSDPRLLAITRVLDAVLPVAYFVADPALIAWLALEALRIWIEHGPGPTLVGPAAHAAYHAGPQRGEYDAAYRGLRRIVALGESRRYEPGTAQARHMLAAVTYWFEPIEQGYRAARRAREALVTAHDPAYAGYTYQLSVPYLMDCAPSLAGFVAEVDEGMAFLRQTGNEQTGQWLDSYRWLAGVLRGDSRVADDPLPADRYADNPLPLLYAHLGHGIAAAIFGDPTTLAQHSAAAMRLLPAAAGAYATAVAHLLRGLALAAQAGAAGGGRGDVLLELDEVVRWLTARAQDAPDNFLHVLRLVEAERAWAVGNFRAALLAFDAARREVAQRRRPWHRALIVERAARFHLAHGVEHAGQELLARARREYLVWGAAAKVERLDWAYPTLRPQEEVSVAGGGDEAPIVAQSRGALGSGTIDLLGILSATQALSSETSIERLHERVVEVLGAMTGATDVHLLLWSEERQDWLLTTRDGVGIDTVGASAHESTIPMSVLRYTQRIGEPLVVADAGRDDRFARDPYLAGVDCCSLLAVPVLSRGRLRGALVLENRLIRGAFSTERLDAVKLIAGQLGVSLDNAQLYSELARSRARIVAGADQARQRIERDLHDGAQQRLLHTIVTLQLAQEALGGTDGEVAALVAEALENAERAIDETRELARGIHPRILRSGGLGPALETLAQRSPIPVTLELRTEARLAEPVEVTAYYVVSEALANAVKHASASIVNVTVEATGDGLRLSISDDGVGGADPARGSGLVGLKDRVEALGGTLTVRSTREEGTHLAVDVPLGPAVAGEYGG